MREFFGQMLVAMLVFVSFLTGVGAGFLKGRESGRNSAVDTGRCPHERMVNYDLHRAIATCHSLQKEIEIAQDHLEKSVKFMDQVKEKLGE